MYKILTDQDVLEFAHGKKMMALIATIERALREHAVNTLVAPPRFRLNMKQGDLVFTAGAATGVEKVGGFRVYDTYDNELEGHEQIVCVFDSDTGIFKGVVIGNLLGAIRTGAIGGAAINAMARPDADHIAVIGTGLQASFQLQAAVAVRDPKKIRAYSRNPDNRRKFAREMTKILSIEVTPVNSARDCLEDADIVICATNSGTPVLKSEWLKPGSHINTLGPKFATRHEVPLDVARHSAVIATDSLDQLRAYPTPHFLVGTSDENRIIPLTDIVVGKATGRHSPNDITLFCSVGLAGTEVVIANEIIKTTSATGMR